jgi:LysM repeat protein
MPRSVRTAGLLVLLIAVLTASAPSLVRIRPGDTLSALALRYHTTVAKLQATNHLRDTTIYAGDLLRLPGNATPVTRPRAVTTSRVYIVRPGDTLIGLAKRYRTTPKALAARNKLSSTMLLIGQRLSYGVTAAAAAPQPKVSKAVLRSAGHHRLVLSNLAVPSRATIRQMISAAARRHGVPSSLALALAWQESGFQQRVVSPADAIGVMQVLPSTARSLGRMHGRTFNLLRASDNIDAGVLLLRDLLAATGSASKAMAGYYQGLGSVNRIGLLEETKRYIKNVQVLQRGFA